MLGKNPLDVVAMVLVVVGALNWGLVGLLDFNLVSALLGDMSMLSRVVYVLVGLSGVVVLLRSLMMNSAK